MTYLKVLMAFICGHTPLRNPKWTRERREWRKELISSPFSAFLWEGEKGFKLGWLRSSELPFLLKKGVVEVWIRVYFVYLVDLLNLGFLYPFYSWNVEHVKTHWGLDFRSGPWEVQRVPTTKLYVVTWEHWAQDFIFRVFSSKRALCEMHEHKVQTFT